MRIFLNMVMLSDHNLCIALKVIYPKAGINIWGEKLYKTVVLEHLHFVEKNKKIIYPTIWVNHVIQRGWVALG